MATIQDIHALEQRITYIVEDYIQKLYNEDDVLAIGRCCGIITIKADAKEKIKIGNTTELHPLKELIRVGDDGKLNADYDVISEIANSWLIIS